MAYKNKLKINETLSDEESLSESDYLTSVLSIVNGYCKVNLVIPQTSTFYTKESLLPINAKVNRYKPNNNIPKSQMINTCDDIADMLKNTMFLKPDLDDNSDQIEDNKETVSLKGKKKKNKYKMSELGTISSALDNQYLVSSTKIICTDQNLSSDYNNQYEIEKLKKKLYSQVRNYNF